MRAGKPLPGAVRLLVVAGLFLLVTGGALAGTAHVTGASNDRSVLTERAPHPFAVPVGPSAPVAAPAIHSTHYWSGAYFTGKARNANLLSTTVKVPDAVPSSSEFYYVLLSVWDSAGSYDQIGFTNDYGHWGFTYSYTSACAGSYYYNPSYVTLTRGTTYTFSMNLSTTGNLTFLAVHGSTVVSKLTKYTGGSHFVDQSFYSCNSVSYYDLTDYEEIYYSVQSMPSFNFAFKANAQNGKSITAWTSMGAPPGGGQIALSGAQVLVENEAFGLGFTAGFAHSAKLPSGTTAYATNLTVTAFFSGTNVTLKALGPASVFNITISPATGAPGFTSTVSIAILAASPGVQYALTLQATDTSSNFTYVTLQLTVL